MSIINLTKYASLFFLLLLFLAGCGGSGGGSDANTVPLLTGQLIDDPVKGITYHCSSEKKGVTDNNGRYTCQEGDTVSFIIGDKTIGPIAVQAAAITPYSFFPDNPRAAVNLARLLQSLDTDGVVDNGVIVINSDISLPATIDFASATFTQDVEAALSIVLISTEKAVAHLNQVIKTLGGVIPQGATIPVADAGIDLQVVTTKEVMLDGSASNGVDASTLSYEWLFISKPIGSQATLSDTKAVKPVFVADKDGAYEVKLIVNNSLLSSLPDTVMITASAADSDVDNDGVTDAKDNCPNDANSDQKDSDGDGAGDVCDASDDSDKDGVIDSKDNCPKDANSDQKDSDGDGAGDVCDASDDTDSDKDGVIDSKDNCPKDANPDQKDSDGDGAGDVCDASDDTDSDKDGVIDSKDNCPKDANSDQKDNDGDGIGDVCDIPLVTGQFIDDPIQGLKYRCSSGQEGVTDSEGKYTCPATDKVSFILGQKTIGPIGVQKAAITPYSFFPNNLNAAINLARLLQSLDQDDQTNGVIIIDSMVPLPASIDFASATFKQDVKTALPTVALLSSRTARANLNDAIIAFGSEVPKGANIPAARAGDDQQVELNQQVTLDGSTSNDADGDTLTYQWRFANKPDGSQATLSDKTHAKPVFIADIAGTYKVVLLVNDGDTDSREDTVSITVLDSDKDKDTVIDSKDNCPDDANLDQKDSDGDGIGDVCDATDDTDSDKDTVINSKDNCPNDANLDQKDTDGDGIGDVCDATDDTDSDKDTVINSKDNCPNDANLDQKDSDGDGIGDVCDATDDTDSDKDTVINSKDNCPNDANLDQKDSDGDGIGDVCDTTDDTDSDKDTVINSKDNCPNDANLDQKDTDGDGIGDVCDTTDDTDSDKDTVIDSKDNCPNDANLDQKDTDGDGIGDVCDATDDTDSDKDTVIDSKDNCPNDANLDQKDSDGDGIGDVCDTTDDTDSDKDTVIDSKDNCPNDANLDQKDTDGDGIGDVCDTNDVIDSDEDGVIDSEDNCPKDANSDQKDLDKDKLGDVCDADRDGDSVNNVDDFFPDNPNASSVPVVSISTPKTLITVGASPIRVEGTINDPQAKIVINGIEISHTDGKFQADVALKEGSNAIIVRAIDKQNHEGTATVTVSLDKTPPYVTIQSPEKDSVVYTERISVGGLVNDIVRGTVSDKDAIVKVNGIAASVSNRSFLAENIALKEGNNTITVTASDAVGNVSTKEMTIDYKIQLERKIELLSGQAQTGEIQGDIAESLKIKLTEKGQPVANKTVTFRVIEGDGLLKPQIGLKAIIEATKESQNSTANVPLLAQVGEAQALVATTDAEGVAFVNFRLGSRSGNGIHRVRAQAVGFEGEVVFYASATAKAGDKLGVIAGNNQRGSVRLPLPSPFVVAVTDLGSNLIEGAKVEFKVVQGGGKFQNDTQTQTVVTDKDGRASVQMILGAEEGLDSQRVTATLVGTSAVAGFTASAFVPGDPGKTSISGVVLDNQDNPLPKVTVRVEGTTRQAESDEQGQFTITEVPVGAVHLIADGSTTSVTGEWPTLSYNLVTVPGVENPLSSPIYLVQLDTEHAVYVGKEDQELTLPEMPGFKLKVKKGSVTFPDGKKEGFLSVTPVNANKIPMPPPNGMQPQFIVTIQPHGAKFDPPAELTLPNVDGHNIGAEVEMYSYDHDLEEFVTIGLGTVSRDGSVITSNTDVGVIKAGWHCGSQPGGSGCCEGGGGGPPTCGECSDLESSGTCPVNYSCKPKSDPDSVVINAQVKGNCKTETCGKPQPNNGDLPPAECGTCKDGNPDIDETKPLEKQEPDDCKLLMCGGEDKSKDETAVIQAKGGDFQCKICKDKSVSNGPDKASCGDGSSTQSCYTCKDGKCGNNCEASSVKHTIEHTAPDYVLNALSNIENIVNRSPIFVAKLNQAIEVKLTSGELCCKSCETPSPQKYKEFSGFAGVKGTVQVTIPGLGVAYQMPPKIIAGSYAIKAEIFATLAGAEIQLNSGATVSYKTSDCPNEDCGSFKLGTELKGTFGPQINGTASFDSCQDSKCKESDVLIGVQLTGGGVIEVGGNFQSLASSGAQCGKTCFGGNIDPVNGKLYFSASVEILFKKYTYSADKTIEFYSGGPLANTCN